jgi:hypothetical protein
VIQLDARDGSESAPRAGHRELREGRLIGYIVGGLVAFLLVSAGIGYAVYSWMNNDLPSDGWIIFQTPDRVCSVSLPGTPTPTPTGNPQIQRYTFQRPQDQLTLALEYRDVDAARARANLDDITRDEMDSQRRALGGTQGNPVPILSGLWQGREFQIRRTNGEVAITRLFLVEVGSGQRVYQATASGPRVKPREGDAARFLHSIVLTPGRSSEPAR